MAWGWADLECDPEIVAGASSSPQRSPGLSAPEAVGGGGARACEGLETIPGLSPALRGMLKDLEASWFYPPGPKVAGTGHCPGRHLECLLQPLQGGQVGGGNGRRWALLGIKVSHLTCPLAPQPGWPTC